MIYLKHKDGSIAIMTLAPGADKEETIQKFQDSHPEYEKCLEGNLNPPKNRIFRDAWTIQNNKIIINERKAKEIHLSRIRERRNEKLKELDQEQLRFLTDNWKTQEIETKKQALRDLPQTFNLENLDLINPKWPIELEAP